MGHKRPLPSFETPRKRAAPQDDGFMCGSEKKDQAIMRQPGRQKQFMRGVMTVPLGRNSCT
jgi:hypothetical protein